jgi:putative membrane protein
MAVSQSEYVGALAGQPRLCSMVTSSMYQMKTTVLSTIAVLASISLGLAQTPTTPTSPTTPSTSTTGGGAKAKPLAQGDKTFLKNSAESMYFLISLCDKSKNGAKTDTVKKLGGKIAGDLNKAWGELGEAAKANNEVLASELKGADKSHAEKLGKAEPDKFDKLFLDEAGKEIKKLARYMESGAKSVQSPELKKVAENWGPTIKGYSDEIDKTEKEVAKAPK